MTKQDLAKRCAVLRQEIDERQQKLNAYEIVLADMADDSEAPSVMETLNAWRVSRNVTTGGAEPKAPVNAGSKTDAVRAIIKTLEQPFSLEDVEKNLGDNPSGIERNDLSFILYRLKKIGEVAQESKGVSGRPSTYKIKAA